jgi:RNA 3'-terminal phosphate cyclase (ATP)
MIRIDGSEGEGGGQILRTALSLSAWLGTPFRITRIREGRSQPGLRAQHLSAIRMTAQVCGAGVEGAQMGSRTLAFTPGPLRVGTYLEEVGTAGATTLVAQAAALPLFSADGPSLLKIRGGTHVAWSPPFDFLREVYAGFLEMLGLSLRARLLGYGFYPRGGGQIAVEIQGVAGRPLRGTPPGRLSLSRPVRDRIRIETRSVVCSLPESIAERMSRTAGDLLRAQGWNPASEEVVGERGPTGTYLFIRVSAPPGPSRDHCVLGGFTGLGQKGKPAEQVAQQAAFETLEFLESGASLDPRLADQVLLPALLAGADLTFTTGRITQHLRTQAEVIEKFLGPCVEIEDSGRVRVRPVDIHA